jgi:hypothetical protein
MAPPNATVGAPSNPLGWIETALKVATAGLGLVAAIGLPAVAVQLARYGVPLATASYPDVLRAGILPAIALLLVTLYCMVASTALKKHGWRRFLRQHSLLLLPLLIPSWFVLVAGLVAYALIAGWGLLWALRWVATGLTSFQATDRDLLFAAGSVELVLLLLVLLARVTRRYWADRRGRFWSWLAGMFDESRSNSDGAPAPSQEATDKKDDETLRWLIFPMLLLMFLLVLYSLKGLLHIWNPAFSSLLPHRLVWLGSTVMGSLFAVFFAVSLLTDSKSSDQLPSRKSWIAVLCIAGVAYLLFELGYSTWGYPRLYSGLGGGRPYPVTLWLKSDDSASDIMLRFRNVRVTTMGGSTRVDSLMVLYGGDATLLVTDASVGPADALQLNRVRLTAVTW